MKKVLFLIHTLGGGGAEKVLVNLVNNLDKNKYEITVMTIIDVGELRYELNDNIKYKTTIKLRKGNNKKVDNKSGSLLNKTSKKKIFAAKLYAKIWKYMPTKLFYKFFIREKYDIEISFLEGICSKVIAASNNKKSKKYAWIHVDLINQPKSSGVFTSLNSEKKNYNKFDKIICVSKVVKEQFIKKFNFDENKVDVKYNAIDKNEIINKSNEDCFDYPFDNDNFTLCSVGRLNGQKSYDRLVRIANKLKNEGYKFNLFIIGEGTSRDELENYIKINYLDNIVKLLGFKSNPYKYMKKSDVFVCSSIAEGYSTVVSEAIVLGIPVVTTDCSGMKEMLGNNEYGIITENSEEALYKGLKRIIDDKNLYYNYKNKITDLTYKFDIKSRVNEVEELF